MPIEPKRVEAAARASFERRGLGHLWLSLTEEARQNHMRKVAEVAADLWPELASDPPAAWVAPWEEMAAMADAWPLMPEGPERSAMAIAYMKITGRYIYPQETR